MRFNKSEPVPCNVIVFICVGSRQNLSYGRADNNGWPMTVDPDCKKYLLWWFSNNDEVGKSFLILDTSEVGGGDPSTSNRWCQIMHRRGRQQQQQCNLVIFRDTAILDVVLVVLWYFDTFDTFDTLILWYFDVILQYLMWYFNTWCDAAILDVVLQYLVWYCNTVYLDITHIQGWRRIIWIWQYPEAAHIGAALSYQNKHWRILKEHIAVLYYNKQTNIGLYCKHWSIYCCFIL